MNKWHWLDKQEVTLVFIKIDFFLKIFVIIDKVIRHFTALDAFLVLEFWNNTHLVAIVNVDIVTKKT